MVEQGSREKPHCRSIMTVKELANQFRESMNLEHQLNDLEVIRMFSKGIKGPLLEECIDRSSNRNTFLMAIDLISEDQ